MRISYLGSYKKLKEDLERRETERKFDVLSDHLFSEEEKDFFKEQRNLKIVGGKNYDEKFYEKVNKLSKD